ncbi:MAG: succinate--CoA ligase subunit alpha [Deltaproteobacteria bacterium]|nr:succinate--CoA ligase subunit alpha [Deltaproteobacteria bacterium]
MSIIVDENTRVVVQGITGREGSFHTNQMLAYGTKVVAGVTPGKQGQTLGGIPIYNQVIDSVEHAQANTAIIFVPPAFAADAIMEAAAAGIKVIVCITEGIPTIDMIAAKKYLQGTEAVLIGPNCPGIISPGKTKVGIMPGDIHKPGSIGVISRSGTLTYEVVGQLTRQGLGQSTCIGIGGDPIIGLAFIELLARFGEDKDTSGVIVIGEIGGSSEEEAAEFVKANLKKPVIGFVAGQTAPPGKRMGHAGAIIAGRSGRAEDKVAAFQAAGIHVVRNLGQLGATAKQVFPA